ncbi:hypothetical protein H696_02190 [Fonticula alba]|uniref:tRNA (Uracil-5-)-methyltransferase n=1 Tax=Fonticula alba TaxID=691883 RepID=A0A058ZAC5_FONAL|nr:hypothetical protein H696_02190 [Fonticula alba]KCV71240.1 hypothetical protein H696_02190 [Fonticula alba]|eukprot:XP_009494363.1 hypothetical protein H696_02190 [Fonticula alba]
MFQLAGRFAPLSRTRPLAVAARALSSASAPLPLDTMVKQSSPPPGDIAAETATVAGTVAVADAAAAATTTTAAAAAAAAAAPEIAGPRATTRARKATKAFDPAVHMNNSLHVTGFRFPSSKNVRKFFEQSGIQVTGIRYFPRNSAFNINFPPGANITEMHEKINTMNFRSRPLVARFRDQSEVDVQEHKDRHQTLRAEYTESDLPAHERLNDQVTPLWRLPYDEQIQQKTDTIKTILQEARKKLVDTYSGTAPVWLDNQSDLLCKLEPTIRSPVTDGYRNKCEFSFGYSPAGKPTVGFLLGLFKEGKAFIESPQQCPHVSDSMKSVAALLQEHVDRMHAETAEMAVDPVEPAEAAAAVETTSEAAESAEPAEAAVTTERRTPFPCYDRLEQSGFWRLAMVRETVSKSMMVVVQVHPQQHSAEVLAAQADGLKAVFEEAIRQERIPKDVLLLWQQEAGLSNAFTNAPVRTLIGNAADPHIYEQLYDLKFRVSPWSFFQVNIGATELLYSYAAELAGLRDGNETVLLDVCCGTGTIGISMAKKAKRVIGIEIVPQAIEDAKFNASLNSITNCSYICNGVEKCMDQVLESLDPNEDAVAILDPPRRGVSQNVVRALRTSAHLKRLVFISCDANQAMQNFVDLCRATTNRHPGKPFRPVLARGVDLFPHARPCELVLYFERD